MSAMDITEEGGKTPATTDLTAVLSTAQNASGLNISIHPLVLLNMSDHYTRIKVQNPERNAQEAVFGAVLATQSGREIDLVNSFELLHTRDENNKVIIDKEYLTMKQEQLKQVFPQLDLMGWYALGTSPSASDIQIHTQFFDINESPLFLQLDPNAMAGGHKELPLGIYESLIDIIDGQAQAVFVRAQYKISTGEAERIAVDHASRPSISADKNGAGGSLISNLTTQRNAIEMLQIRVRILLEYLKDTEAGIIPVDHDIERQISSLCNRLPVVNNKDFNAEFLKEYNDVVLTSYLAAITKGVNNINELVDKVNFTHNAPGSYVGGRSSSGRKGKARTFA
ncbi:Mov34/MPN/PAD-1 family protein [Umbelopsis sp. AD052]|nr:Mov34/MPN/PAD-1 family protein [Umbelopsis sp. AD052]